MPVSRKKMIFPLILLMLVAGTDPCFAQKGGKTQTDTLHGTGTDSFVYDLGNVPMTNFTIVKYFVYEGPANASIVRTLTGDPHYICKYPEGPLTKGTKYSFSICFANATKSGVFNKTMGFVYSNGAQVKFVFKGTVLPADQ